MKFLRPEANPPGQDSLHVSARDEPSQEPPTMFVVSTDHLLQVTITVLGVHPVGC